MASGVAAEGAGIGERLGLAAADAERIGMGILVADVADGVIRFGMAAAGADGEVNRRRGARRGLGGGGGGCGGGREGGRGEGGVEGDAGTPDLRAGAGGDDRGGKGQLQPGQPPGERERAAGRPRLAERRFAHCRMVARFHTIRPRRAWNFPDGNALAHLFSRETCGAVAQFGRAPEWHSGGREFDPHRLHQSS
jgi:hypothetical protein